MAKREEVVDPREVAAGRVYLLRVADWLERLAEAGLDIVEGPGKAASLIREIALAGDLAGELEDWYERQGQVSAGGGRRRKKGPG